MDLEFIKSKGYETITPVIFTNLEAGKTIEVSEGKSVKAEAGRVGLR